MGVRAQSIYLGGATIDPSRIYTGECDSSMCSSLQPLDKGSNISAYAGIEEDLISEEGVRGFLDLSFSSITPRLSPVAILRPLAFKVVTDRQR